MSHICEKTAVSIQDIPLFMVIVEEHIDKFDYLKTLDEILPYTISKSSRVCAKVLVADATDW